MEYLLINIFNTIKLFIYNIYNNIEFDEKKIKFYLKNQHIDKKIFENAFSLIDNNSENVLSNKYFNDCALHYVIVTDVVYNKIINYIN